jgi:Ulp1 family protease
MQNNFSDCGLFVYAYLERFAKDLTAFKKQGLEKDITAVARAAQP